MSKPLISGIALKPRILLAYPFLDKADMTGTPGWRDWFLDSGAYTAANTGITINLEEFTAVALKLQKNDPALAGVFALDVLNDPETTIKNSNFMRKAGVNVIPTWHISSDVSHLRHLKKNFDRIAIGGLAQRLTNHSALKLSSAQRRRGIEVAFSELWPHWIHGFGCSGRDLLEAFPFASVDASTWHLRPSAYGNWKRFGKFPIRLTSDKLWLLKTEALWFMELEAKLSIIWAKELKKIKLDRMSIALACLSSDIALFKSFFP